MKEQAGNNQKTGDKLIVRKHTVSRLHRSIAAFLHYLPHPLFSFFTLFIFVSKSCDRGGIFMKYVSYLYYLLYPYLILFSQYPAHTACNNMMQTYDYTSYYLVFSTVFLLTGITVFLLYHCYQRYSPVYAIKLSL